MQIYIRPMAIITLVAALGAAGAPGSVTLVRSNVPYRQAFSACIEGSLGAIVISPAAHVRVSLGSGVASDIDDANPNAIVIMLTDQEKSQSATVTVNSGANTVAAKNVVRAANGRVACVTRGD